MLTPAGNVTPAGSGMFLGISNWGGSMTSLGICMFAGGVKPVGSVLSPGLVPLTKGANTEPSGKVTALVFGSITTLVDPPEYLPCWSADGTNGMYDSPFVA